jgi:hypothetical protein
LETMMEKYLVRGIGCAAQNPSRNGRFRRVRAKP